MVKAIAHLSAILFATLLFAINIGRVLPRGAQLLYTSSSNWWAETWNVFVLDVERDIAQRLLTSGADRLPGLSLVWSPDGIQLAYLSHDSQQTYMVDPQGSHVRRLSGNPTDFEYNAAWSPDGQHLAFIGEYNGLRDVYLAAPDGENVRRITFGSPNFKSLVWSPNSCCLALESEGIQSDIYILTIADGTLRNLTDSEGSDLRPSWSPDNRWIAFISSRESRFGNGRLNLYLIGADGKGLQALTDDFPADNSWVANWSPDGERIVFGSNTWSGGRDIYRVDVRTGLVQNVTADTARDSSAVWSPDGRHFAFESKREGHWRVYVMNVEGETRKVITDVSSDIRRPVWSPDGRHLVYISNPHYNWDLYMTSLDSPLTWRITYSQAIDTAPLWRP